MRRAAYELLPRHRPLSFVMRNDQVAGDRDRPLRAEHIEQDKLALARRLPA